MNSFSKKTFIVARHEFLKTIKRKEFIFITFFFPFLFAGISVLPAVISGISPTEGQRVGYIDMTGSFEFPESIHREGFSLEPSEVKTSVVEFVMYSDISDARQALQAGQISSYLVIHEDFLKTGTIELYSFEKEASMQNFGLSAGLSNIVITSLLKDKVDELTLNRVRDPVNIKFYNVGESGESSEQGINDIFASFGLPFLTAFFLFFSIFSSSGFLLRGVAEEKENRIIEILLSSATPFEILTGKIFGLGAVGLLQVLIWLVVITLGSGYALTVKIEPTTLFLAVIYFIFGFLFFASVMAGIGAVTSSIQESQQIAGIFTFVAAFPLIFMQMIVTSPDSLFSVFLSLFPISSPVAMLARMGTTSVPLYQILASIFILLISVYVVILLSSRLFRTYLLMYGKRPKVKEIWKNIWTESRSMNKGA
ncbi:ABC transporter permease [Methanosarcina barkeri]|uniref:ABC transporter permease protein n=1 Tax=Methanosarcina barkeri CM1 TaxID=796385 RepID=A0A0G3CMS3_METBA|nr:ABC transporter permease [Methanosarcina barkeri]AKJ40427.1 ABC transporter permease protein [Methanosarcina barkeri CM1]